MDNKRIIYHLLRDSDFHAAAFGSSHFPSYLGQVLNYLDIDKFTKIKCILDLSPQHWEELRKIFKLNSYFIEDVHIRKLTKEVESLSEMNRKDFVEVVKKYYKDKHQDKIELIELKDINYVTGIDKEVIKSIYIDLKCNEIFLINVLPKPLELKYTLVKGFEYKAFSQLKLTDRVTMITDVEDYNIIKNRKIGWEVDPLGTNGSEYSIYTFLSSQGQNPEWLDNFLTKVRKRVDVNAFEKLVTIEEEFEDLIEYSKYIAGHEENVLILGETGVGKELFARGIHENSSRKEGQFVAINCAAIPDSLFESEMFGIKKGAFTDAKEDREGYFQLANGGTLFLDEIGDLSLHNQAKILRAIQEKKVVKVGGKGEADIADVRLISATNKGLSGADNSEFRSDLLFRIGVMQIRIPPLRERGQMEIIFLTQYFWEQMCTKYNAYDYVKFDDSAEKIIKEYKWPGNVRQLESFVYNIVLYAGYEMKKRRKEFAAKYKSKQITIPDIISYTISESEVRAFLNEEQKIPSNQMNEMDSSSLKGEGQERSNRRLNEEDDLICSEILIKNILKDPSKIENELQECKKYIWKRVHEELLKEYKTESKVGEVLGVTQQTISLRLKKLGLKNKD